MDVLEAEGVDHVYGLPGGHGERVDDPIEVSEALGRALAATTAACRPSSTSASRQRMLGTLEHYSFYPAELVEAGV